MERNYEKESAKVADAITNDSNIEAATSLSNALIPMNHADHKEFLELVQSKLDSGKGNFLDLDFVSNSNRARLWADSKFQPNFVIVLPDQNLTSICKYDIQHAKKDLTQKEINNCIDNYADANSLDDPEHIIAGKTLLVPPIGKTK